MFGFFKKKETPPIIEIADFAGVGVDFHSHLIPAIDDGVQKIEESLTILRNFHKLGFKKIITTPHIMTESYNNNRTNIEEGYLLVKEAMKHEGIDLEFEFAAEYYMDDTFDARIDREELLTFGNNYLLVEKSMFQEMNNFNDLIYKLLIKGHRVIIAHPERYKYMYERGKITQFESMKDRGVLLQLNLFSLVGLYGRQTQEIAEKLIDADLIDFVSSDIHKPDQIVYLRDVLKSPYFDKLLKSESLLNQNLLN